MTNKEDDRVAVAHPRSGGFAFLARLCTGAALAALGLVGGCSAPVAGPSTGADATGGGGGGDGSSGGNAPHAGSTNAAASPLNGTWDLLASIDGRARTGTLTIAPTRFALTWETFHTEADVSASLPAIAYSFDRENGPVSTTHIGAPLDLGQIPYAIGGAWSFRGRGSDQCTARVDVGAATMDCSNLVAPLVRVFQGYDETAHRDLGWGTTSAQRGPVLPSIFGELGGEWVILTPRVQCTAKFEGNHFDASCDTHKYASPPRPEVVTLTFADGLASGTTNAGELSARRR